VSENEQQPASWEAKPSEEHRWLRQLVGEWSFESDPSTPEEERFKGVERVRPIGHFWVVGLGMGEGPGNERTMMQLTLGYDPKRGRFVGTWVGSMMTFMWVYEGELDAERRVLTLNADGPDMLAPDKMAKYQDVVELVSEDHRTLTSRVLRDDGQWQEFMKMHFRRQRRLERGEEDEERRPGRPRRRTLRASD
jgi:hypothetical protein